MDNEQPIYPRKRKSVSLCRHKLQGRTSYKSKSWKLPAPEIRNIQDADIEYENEDDDKWAQLQRVERLLEQQRMKLLQQGVPDSDDEDGDEPQWLHEAEDHFDEVENDSLNDEDLTFITSVLDSFSYTESDTNKLRELSCVIRTLEGATAQAKAEPMTP
jgi:hypothetical protein